MNQTGTELERRIRAEQIRQNLIEQTRLHYECVLRREFGPDADIDSLPLGQWAGGVVDDMLRPLIISPSQHGENQ